MVSKKMEPDVVPTFSPSDLTASLNQTFEVAYSKVLVVGELSNFRVSKNRWVYFDIKDDSASLKCFGTIYQLPGPLEDGLMVELACSPRLHPNFGFSLNISAIRPVGQGALRRAAELLRAKLEAEGLFNPDRKRPLPFAPQTIGVITSAESAAYSDFIKVTNERFAGLELLIADVQVQGLSAPEQIVAAITYFNQSAQPPEVLVITRGGGSSEDLAAFDDERIVRAIAASRIPTLVAIGHERDVSLAELAADVRASTPSNAVQLLLPDKQYELSRLGGLHQQILDQLQSAVTAEHAQLTQRLQRFVQLTSHRLQLAVQELQRQSQLLGILDPNAALQRGYALVRDNKRLLRSVAGVSVGANLTVQLSDGTINATVSGVSKRAK